MKVDKTSSFLPSRMTILSLILLFIVGDSPVDALFGGIFSSSSSSESSDGDGSNRKASKPKEENAIMYGEDIFIQSASENRRFLVVIKQDGKYKNVGTRNPWDDYQEADYKWELLKPSSNGGSVEKDCVRFGDTVYVKNIRGISRKWLYNSDSKGDAKMGEYSHKDADKFKVVVRQNPGDGNPKETDDDPSKGTCVTDITKVYLQSYYDEDRWLQGKGKESSNYRDYHEDEDEERKKTFHWILRKETGNGYTDITKECIPKGAVGKWKYIRSAYGGDTTVTITEGNTRTKDESTTLTKSWSTSVSATISANFAAGSASVTATGTYGQDAAKTVSNSLEMTEDVSHATTWYTPGAIFQYVIETGDTCVPNWDVSTMELIQTPNKQEEPCCLPGYFADVDPVTNKANPRGFCAEGSPCMCGDFCDDPSRGKPPAEDEEEGPGEGDAGAEEQDAGGDTGAEEQDERCKYGTEQELRAKGCYQDENSGGSSGGSTGGNYGGYGGGYGDYYGGGYPMYNDYYGGGGGSPMYDDYYGGGGGYPMYDDYYGGAPMYDDYYGGGGMYDDYYGPGGHGGHHGGHGVATPAPVNPLLGYTGDKPLISLNINQANTNNNQGVNGNDNSNDPPAAPPAEEDDYLPPDFEDDDMYQGGDDYQAIDDDDDDDDGNANAGDDTNDDYLDIVLDALDSIDINARRKFYAVVVRPPTAPPIRKVASSDF